MRPQKIEEIEIFLDVPSKKFYNVNLSYSKTALVYSDCQKLLPIFLIVTLLKILKNSKASFYSPLI